MLAATAAMTGCTSRAPVAAVSRPRPLLTIRPLRSASSPAPFSEVRAGLVRAVIPQSWEAKRLPSDTVAQEGFVASPRIDRFERGTGTVQGIEAFWIDVGKVGLASDYYYLIARNGGPASLMASKRCTYSRRVLLDHEPDFTRIGYSPGDYVATASGTCLTRHHAARWAYVVAAPGYGPMRDVGLPNSGLYVVLAVVSGRNADRILKEMIQGARFGETSVSQIVQAAGRLQ
jgi:hypothetical protein